jgi:hypothetical protein
MLVAYLVWFKLELCEAFGALAFLLNSEAGEVQF